MDTLQLLHKDVQQWLDDARRTRSGAIKLDQLDERLTDLLDRLEEASGDADLHELLSLWMLLIQELAVQATFAQGSWEEKFQRTQDWSAQAGAALLQAFSGRTLIASAATQLEVLTVLAQHLLVEDATPVLTAKLIDAASRLTAHLHARNERRQVSTVTFEEFGGRTAAIDKAFVESGKSLELSGRRQGAKPDGAGSCKKTTTFFATFRNHREYRNPYLVYGSKWAKELTYGVAQVSIPLSRMTYSLRRDFALERDHRKHHRIERGEYFVLENLEILDSKEFDARLRTEIQQNALMVFVHGFRQTHGDALIHAAQLFHDMALEGAPLVLSWPAGFMLGSKSYSDSIVEYSRKGVVDAFAGVINKAAREAGATEIVLVGHSLGCRILSDISSSLNLADKRFTHIVLASPDIEIGKFKAAIGPAANAEKRMTVYASRSDRALQFASWLYGERAGAQPGRIAGTGYKGLDVIATEGCFYDYPDFWRHSDFSCGAAPDLRDAIRKHTPLRRRLEERKTKQGNYWIIS